MNKEEIINEVMGSFKMTVDAKGLKKLEKYIDNLEQENQQLKDRINKAIEWVINWTHDPNNWFEVDAKPSELLEILKEDNKEKVDE